MLLNQSSRTERLESIAKELNVDAFLFTSQSTISCLSGYNYYFEIGPSPFQLLPSALLVVASKLSTIIIADNESFENSGIGTTVKVKPYASYTYQKPLDFAGQFLKELNATINEKGLTNARFGIEQNTLPFIVSKSLAERFPGISLIDITEEITTLKAVKDNDEIDKIRKTTALCDMGQAAVLKFARPGMTELELFSLIRTEMEATAGTRVPIMLDLVSGSRTAEGGGIPSDKVIQQGDLVLSDLTPCLNGYWGDTCNTIVLGEPTAEQKRYFKIIQEALKLAIDFIKPGVKANEIDQMLRKYIEPAGQYGHHSGHGVGTTNHEEPRIVPYNEMILKPNMVIALEPAIYTESFGIRLEHLVLVTETGCKRISKFHHTFEQK